MTAFSTLTRRSILRLFGAAPALLPAAKVAAPSLLATAEPVATAAAVAKTVAEVPEPSGQSILGKLLAGQMRDLKHQFETEEWWGQQMRIEGIDHDLAALKSTSRAWKVMKMAQRHRERYTLYRRVYKTIWPDN